MLATALAAPSAGAAVANVSVSGRPTTAPIPDDFLGLALEYSTIPAWTEGGSGPVNPVLVRLIRKPRPGRAPVGPNRRDQHPPGGGGGARAHPGPLGERR